MGKEEVYQGLKRAFHHRAKSLQQADGDPHTKLDIHTELQESCKA